MQPGSTTTATGVHGEQQVGGGVLAFCLDALHQRRFLVGGVGRGTHAELHIKAARASAGRLGHKLFMHVMRNTMIPLVTVSPACCNAR